MSRRLKERNTSDVWGGRWRWKRWSEEQEEIKIKQKVDIVVVIVLHMEEGDTTMCLEDSEEKTEGGNHFLNGYLSSAIIVAAFLKHLWKWEVTWIKGRDVRWRDVLLSMHCIRKVEVCAVRSELKVCHRAQGSMLVLENGQWGQSTVGWSMQRGSKMHEDCEKRAKNDRWLKK